MLTRRLLGRSAIVALVGLGLCMNAPKARADDREAYPHLIHAIYEMRESLGELKAERFAKHRERAGKDLEVAIEEAVNALKSTKIEWKYEGPKNPKEFYREFKEFPHMHQAIVELREARKEIEEEKKHDWGGRREHAVKAINAAIDRVEEAMKAEK
jgi:hypothetical protein